MEGHNWLRQRTFEWTQPGETRAEYVLMAGGQRMGELRFDHWSRATARGTTPFGRWKMVRDGFWQRRYVFLREETGEEVAVYTPRWGSMEGTLQTSGGKRFLWGKRSFWKDEHLLTDETGAVALTLNGGVENSRWTDLFKQQGTVTIGESVGAGDLLSILLLFSWWMTLVEAEESAAAAVVVM